MSSVARHERCNTFSTRRVFLIHLEIPCCIYIIFLFKIYTYYYVFCYTSSWCDVFSNTFTSGCIFFSDFLKMKKIWKKNTSTSGCIEKYISLVKMYKKIRNRKIELKKKIIMNKYHLKFIFIYRYWGNSYPRLLKIKKFWDPENIFNYCQSIGSTNEQCCIH